MKNSKIFYGWWVVLGSAIILAMLGPAPVAVANIFQTPITAEFNITNSQFALSNSLVLGVGIFLSPFVSKSLMSGNFKRIYTINLVIYTLSYIGYGFTTNIYIFYLLSLLVGYGYLSTTIIPVSMLINNWFVQKRGLAMSLAFTGLGVGGVIFSQFVTFLLRQVGWRQTYMIYGSLMLVIVLPIIWFLIHRAPEDIGMNALGNKMTTTERPGDNEQAQGIDISVSQTRTKPFFLLLVFGTILIGIVNNGGLAQFPPVLTNLHGAETAATIISVYSGVGIIGKLVLGNISDRFGIIISTIYACTLLVITYAVMIFAGNIIAAFTMAVFFGFGNAIGTILPPLITSAIYSSNQFSKAYGYVNSGMTLGMTLGSIFTAGIADFTGSYTYSWIVLAILSTMSAILWIGSYNNAQKYISSTKNTRSA